MSNFDFNIIEAKNGLKSIQVNGYILHSKYDPIKEAERIVEKEYKENYLNILFGYGLGYIAQSLKQKMGNKINLIIIEPFKELIVKGETDLYCIGDTDLINNVINSKLENFDLEINVICAPNYDKIAPSAFRDLLKIIKDIQYKSIINENTVNIHSKSFQENYIKNLMVTLENPTLLEIEKKYSLPVVIASGGPSLTKQIPLLKEYKNKFILIAAGSTINSLEANGVIPDYIVTIDGSESNYEHFKEFKSSVPKLIYSLGSQYNIQHEYKGDMYSFLIIDDLKTKMLLEKKYNLRLPLIPGGGSVAHFALMIAMFITTGPIAIIGQDLAYTDNKTHAENNQQFQKIDEDFIQSRGAFTVEGYHGDEVLTDYGLYNMQTTFVDLVKHYEHDAGVYNCTEGGVMIKGFEQIPFNNFIQNFGGNENDKVICTSEKTLDSIDYLDLIKKLETEVEVYTKVEKILSSMLIDLKLEKRNNRFSNKLLKKLEKADVILKEEISEIMMDRILDPITIFILKRFKAKPNETELEKFERIYYRNYELYKNLKEVSMISKEITVETINMIKQKGI